MSKNLNKGKKGEDIAIIYLRNKGYKILARNYFSDFGEIDIIAQKENYIVFVEVKTRKKHTKFTAFEAVDIIKQKKIIKTAMIYLTKNNLNLQPRFDVIAVNFDKNFLKENFCKEEIIHIKNAFDGVDFFETF